MVRMLGYEYTLEDLKQNNYEKGREEGLKEGEDEMTTVVIIRMLENHESMERIIRYSGADEETVRTVARENGLAVKA